MTSPRLKIGISACLFHPDPQRTAAPSKTLNWIEQSTAHWLMRGGALPVMIPPPPDATPLADDTPVGTHDYASWLDGLVLHGGADVWPGHYGEEPLQPQWNGDRLRDLYEMALLRAFVDAGKPVFGICRGLQLLNVSYGGSLFQDLSLQHEGARVHREAQSYDLHLHEVEVLPGTRLARLLGPGRHRINSIHHQGIRRLAPGFEAEAISPEDGLIEAIRHTGSAWLGAVQWHPEFHRRDLPVMDDTPLLQDFLEAARAARP
ncbi:gamma-glutamyl-gamma-aminobutyrate hydrolase family protein [Ramlibacter aurantiacus]|uniref:gamma-glutamyl-gamma-aminobutyrate hydrolase family protein n=1 Tax=Ramlibacter aurantiacus TaxID=2801330 RepID=UPI00338E38BB